MTAGELALEIEDFLRALGEHQKLWRQSINNIFPTKPERNVEQIREQAKRLSRKLGRLRPYINRFMPSASWRMIHRSSGAQWDALDMAVSADAVAQIKGSSLQTVIERLNQVLGRLDGMDKNEDLDKDSRREPLSSRRPEGASEIVDPSPPVAAAAQPVSPLAAEPVTLERVSLRDLVSAFGRFSLGTWLTTITVLIAVLGFVVTVTRLSNDREVSALRDTLRTQSHSLDSLESLNDSLTRTPPRRR